jgi:ribosomal protein L10/ribosomal protein L7/L12
MKPAIAKKQQVVSVATDHLQRYSSGTNTIALAQFSHMSVPRMNHFRELLRAHNTEVRVIKRRLASRLLTSRPDWAPLNPFANERIMLVCSEGIQGLVGMQEAIDKLGVHDRIFVVAAVVTGELVEHRQIQSLVDCRSVDGVYASALSMALSAITEFLRLMETLVEGTDMNGLLEKIKSANTQDTKVKDFLESLCNMSVAQIITAKELFEETTGIKAMAVAAAPSGASGVAAPVEETTPTVVVTEILNALGFAKAHKKLLDEGKIKGENLNLVALAKEAKAAIENKEPVTFELNDAKDIADVKKSLADVATLK